MKIGDSRRCLKGVKRHAQEPNPKPNIEVMSSDSTVPRDVQCQDANLDPPIAIRKGSRECTKRPLYPFAHYVSFKNLSPTH